MSFQFFIEIYNSTPIQKNKKKFHPVADESKERYSMAQSAIVSNKNQSPEKEAWELFEVGSYDETIRIAEGNPDSHLLAHLSILARLENGEPIPASPTKGISIFSPMVEAYINAKNKKFSDASNQLSLYYKNQNALISYPFTRKSVDIFFRVKNYDLSIAVIRSYKKKYSDLAFIKEEAISLYFLKKYNEVISLYQMHPKELNDSEVHRILGMALLFLGRHKDAENVLEKVPGKLKLPSFDEKKKEYDLIIKNLSSYEIKKKDLNPKDLEDLGFAYLFSGEYSKAEKTFTELTSLLR